ncbi:ABC transporter ATP-binding protein [Actinomadura sp. KC06]|uniref:ABC transporter ATP-binding protein n=1 Tax=Actinomadura sp. KC06 TaxID=2530369 RepID=UPI00104BD26D|nr:ABC transporter ATP-binding protein [Actinomadura sp. KC06]TDD40205.1 ABC transporter ATP-binding protein [Actinomadura sp. KC06]
MTDRADAGPALRDTAPALRVDGLTVELDRAHSPAQLVTDVSFDIRPGEMVGLVGESGSGKSLTASAVAGLLPRGVRLAGGRIELAGQAVDGDGVRTKRRDSLAMVFQNPMTSLNPSMRVGDQVAEALRTRRKGMSRRDARKRAVQILDDVGIDRAAERARQYPFEFSGGMRQRVMIAIAVAGDPSVLIADEPTTALDVTVQQGVMDLIDRLRRDLGLAILLVSHDLALVSERCDRLLIMYAGELVETGKTSAVLGDALHPYVNALARCIPERAIELGTIRSLPGSVPQPGQIAAGCRFLPRCSFGIDACAGHHPPLAEHVPGRDVRCLRAGEPALAEDPEDRVTIRKDADV